MINHWRPFLFGLFVGLLSVPLILILNRRPAAVPIALAPLPPTVTPVPLRVHVLGAVRAPDVYELPAGSIVRDAIEAAGGLTGSAAADSLNLAGLLNDGQQLYVPAVSPTAAAPTQNAAADASQPPTTPQPPAATPPPAAPSGPVNINTASQAQLESLPRIGPAIAQRIIEYRTLRGPFTTIEQIKNVKGIGEATFNAIKDYITVR